MKPTDYEKYFSGMLKNDMPELLPDPAVEKRLEYVLQLKANKRRTTENSFLSLITGFFSVSHFGIKAGIITGLLLFTLLFNKIPERGGYHVRTTPLLADSSYCDTLVDSGNNRIEDLK
jgi:hypothetical protein